MLGRAIGSAKKVGLQAAFRRFYGGNEVAHKPQTMDWMPHPYGPWKPAYEEQQRRYNRVLLLGIVSMSLTLAYYCSGAIDFVLPPPRINPPPSKDVE